MPLDIVHSDRAGHTEETVAQLAISGMMCEIACVSKVRKELYDVQGVAHADIHFDKDLNVDTAFVAYDPALSNQKTSSPPSKKLATACMRCNRPKSYTTLLNRTAKRVFPLTVPHTGFGALLVSLLSRHTWLCWQEASFA